MAKAGEHGRDDKCLSEATEAERQAIAARHEEARRSEQAKLAQRNLEMEKKLGKAGPSKYDKPISAGNYFMMINA